MNPFMPQYYNTGRRTDLKTAKIERGEIIMKRLTAGILTAALILALAGTTALASGRCHGRQELCYPSCAICGGTALHCQDADGDGVCDGFTDEDGDGVCDHHAEAFREFRHSTCGGRHQGRHCH